MVTAAKGAEKFYTLENNKARYYLPRWSFFLPGIGTESILLPYRRETVEEARKIDERLITAWLGHHNQRIVNNSTSFERTSLSNPRPRAFNSLQTIHRQNPTNCRGDLSDCGRASTRKHRAALSSPWRGSSPRCPLPGIHCMPPLQSSFISLH